MPLAAGAQDRLSVPLQLGARTIRLDQPQVMGIVNATPDSFSDGGAYADPPGRGRGSQRPPTRPSPGTRPRRERPRIGPGLLLQSSLWEC